MDEKNLKYYEIINCLRNRPSNRIWSDGSEILVKTEDQADVVADLLEALLIDEDVNTGYYDPIEDKRNNEVDDHTGWWYVNWE